MFTNNKKNKSILIVEDNQDIRESLRWALEWEGFQVFEAIDGQNGLDFLEQNIPDIILADLMMPKMNGWQFVERLKQNATLSTIPVVGLTAFSDRNESIASATDAFIHKPIDLNLLIETLNSILLKAE